MILVDANLLLYSCIEQAPEHAAARTWLQTRLGGSSRVGLPWQSLFAFVRIATNPRVGRAPLSLATAWSQVEDWLDCDAAWIPQPTERHAGAVGALLRTRGLRSDDVPDVHLAAIAIEHGLTLCSSDGGFARFAALRWENPLR